LVTKLWAVLQAFLITLANLLKMRKVLICRLGQCAISWKIWGSRPNEVIECYQLTLSYRQPSCRSVHFKVKGRKIINFIVELGDHC
jgi:hypothetical protein